MMDRKLPTYDRSAFYDVEAKPHAQEISEFLSNSELQILESIRVAVGERDKDEIVLRVSGTKEVKYFRITQNYADLIFYVQLIKSYRESGDVESAEKLLGVFKSKINPEKIFSDKKLFSVRSGLERTASPAESMGSVQEVVDIIQAVKADYTLESFDLRRREKIRIFTYARQQKILEAIYQELAPEVTLDTLLKFCAEHPQHIVTQLRDIFGQHDVEHVDEIPTEKVAEAAKLVNDIPADQQDEHTFVVKILLKQLAETPPYDTLRVTDKVGKGAMGRVVHAVVEDSEVDQHRDALIWDFYVALFPKLSKKDLEVQRLVFKKELVFRIMDVLNVGRDGYPDSLSVANLTQIKDLISAENTGNRYAKALEHLEELLVMSSKDEHDAHLYKILVPMVGSHNELDAAEHVNRVKTHILKHNPPPGILSSLALPRFPYRADIVNPDGRTISTTVFEIEEAPNGVPLTKWKPDSLEELTVVMKQINEVMKYLFSIGVYNVDSGDPMINVQKLKAYIQHPNENDKSFISFYDLDDAIVKEAADKVHYPISLLGGSSMAGKPINFNVMLIRRNMSFALDLHAAQFADEYNYMVQLFNQLIGGQGLDYFEDVPIEKNGLQFQLEPLDLSGVFYIAPENFIRSSRYPLISFTIFFEKLHKVYPQVQESIAQRIYNEFNQFFQAYHRSTKLLDKSRLAILAMQPDDATARLSRIISFIEHTALSDRKQSAAS